MSATATLAAMPPEVLESIAELTESKDLISLRLTSRDMAAKVLRTYTRVLCEHQAYYLNSEISLAHALMVAQHSVFGPALKTLSLLVEEVQHDWDVEKEIKLVKKMDTAHKRKMRGLGMPPSLKHEKRVQELEACIPTWTKQERFRHEGGQMRALEQLMEQFALNGKPVGISLTDTGGCDIKPARIGGCIMSKAPGLETPGHHSAEPIHVVHQTLRHSKILGNLVTSLAFEAVNWSPPTCMVPALNFDGLTELDLEFNTARPFPRDHHLAGYVEVDDEDDVRPMLDALVSAASHSLRNLTIYNASFTKG